MRRSWPRVVARPTAAEILARLERLEARQADAEARLIDLAEELDAVDRRARPYGDGYRPPRRRRRRPSGGW